MNNIEDDIKLVGINPETWRKFKEMYVQDDLPGFLQAEAEAREREIPDEAVFRHRKAMAMRAFAWYKLCKDEKQKMKLAETYNRIAMMSVRER